MTIFPLTESQTKFYNKPWITDQFYLKLRYNPGVVILKGPQCGNWAIHKYILHYNPETNGFTWRDDWVLTYLPTFEFVQALDPTFDNTLALGRYLNALFPIPFNDVNEVKEAYKYFYGKSQVSFVDSQ